MANVLSLRKIADLVDGVSGHAQPAWYEVDGLPNGQKALVESTGNPKNQWRINQLSPASQGGFPIFETPEEALEALKLSIIPAMRGRFAPK